MNVTYYRSNWSPPDAPTPKPTPPIVVECCWGGETTGSLNTKSMAGMPRRTPIQMHRYIYLLSVDFGSKRALNPELLKHFGKHVRVIR